MTTKNITWALPDSFLTSAGKVRAGIAGEGEPLVLAHGWPWSSYSWHRIIPLLARRYRVHWYDMPGFGASEKDRNQATSLDVQAVIFGEMLDHWQLEKPRIIAHDFGGAITLRSTLLHGREFESLVLMNVVAMRPWGSEFFDHVGRHVDAFQGLPPHIHKAVVEAYINSALAVSLPAEDLSALIAPWIDGSGRESFYRQFAQADERYTAEVEYLYGKVACRVSILWGEKDPWIPIERGRRLNQAIPHSSFEKLAGLGHLPQLENPAMTYKVISEKI